MNLFKLRKRNVCVKCGVVFEPTVGDVRYDAYGICVVPEKANDYCPTHREEYIKMMRLMRWAKDHQEQVQKARDEYEEKKKPQKYPEPMIKIYGAGDGAGGGQWTPTPIERRQIKTYGTSFSVFSGGGSSGETTGKKKRKKKKK